MGKISITHAKGKINDRYFIAKTEKVGKSVNYVCLEHTATGWVRHNVTRARLGNLYRALTKVTATA